MITLVEKNCFLLQIYFICLFYKDNFIWTKVRNHTWTLINVFISRSFVKFYLFKDKKNLVNIFLKFIYFYFSRYCTCFGKIYKYHHKQTNFWQLVLREGRWLQTAPSVHWYYTLSSTLICEEWIETSPQHQNQDCWNEAYLHLMLWDMGDSF